MKHIKKSIVSLFLLGYMVSFPLPSHAQGGVCDFPAKGAKFSDLVKQLECIIYKSFVPALFAIALALFIWWVVNFMLNDADESTRAKGKQYIVWGLVALTVMLSVWGLVAIFGDTFGFDATVMPKLPE